MLLMLLMLLLLLLLLLLLRAGEGNRRRWLLWVLYYCCCPYAACPCRRLASALAPDPAPAPAPAPTPAPAPAPTLVLSLSPCPTDEPRLRRPSSQTKTYTYLYDESLLSILYLFRGCSAFSVPTASSYLWDRAALLLEHAETSHTSGTAQSTFFCPCWSGGGGRGSSLVEMQSGESGNENDHHRPWEPRSHAARWSRVAAASSQSRMSPSRV